MQRPIQEAIERKLKDKFQVKIDTWTRIVNNSISETRVRIWPLNHANIMSCTRCRGSISVFSF